MTVVSGNTSISVLIFHPLYVSFILSHYIIPDGMVITNF